MNKAIRSYNMSTKDTKMKTTGCNIRCLFRTNGLANSFSGSRSVVVLDEVEGETRKHRRKDPAKPNTRETIEDDVNTVKFKFKPGDIISVSTPNDSFSVADFPPMSCCIARDFDPQTALIKDKTGKMDSRDYLNCGSITSDLIYTDVADPAKPVDYSMVPTMDELFNVLDRLGLVKIPIPPFDIRKAPETAYPISSEAFVFRTGVSKRGDDTMTVLFNESFKEGEFTLITKPQKGQTPKIILCLPFWVDINNKMGIVVLTKAWGNELSFGLVQNDEYMQAVWVNSLGPAIAYYDDLLFVGDMDWTKTLENCANSNVNNSQRGKLVQFDDAGDTGDVEYKTGGAYCINAAPLLDFHVFLERCAINVSPTVARRVWSAKSLTGSKAYTDCCELASTAHGVQFVNGGNTLLRRFFEAHGNEGDIMENPDNPEAYHNFGKCKLVPSVPWAMNSTGMMEGIGVINEAIHDKKVTSDDVMKWLVDGTIPKENGDIFAAANVKLLRPKFGIIEENSAVYVVGKRLPSGGFTKHLVKTGVLHAETVEEVLTGGPDAVEKDEVEEDGSSAKRQKKDVDADADAAAAGEEEKEKKSEKKKKKSN